MLSRTGRHDIDVPGQQKGAAAACAMESGAEIGAAFEGAALVGARPAFIFGEQSRPVRLPKIGDETNPFEPGHEIFLALPLARPGLLWIRFDDGREGDEVAKCCDEAVRGACN